MSATLNRLHPPCRQITPVCRLLVLLCGLLSGWAPPTQAATPNTPVRIQLSWKYQFQFAPIIAAKELGYYQQAGLDVTVLEGGPGIDAVSQVTRGEADFGIYSSALIVKYGEGEPVVALAAIMQHSPVAIIAHQDRLSSVLGLAGKTIAVSPDTRDEIIAYLRAAGVSDQRVNLIAKNKVGLGNLENADAVSAYVSNEGFYLSDNGNQYMLLTPRSAGIDMFGNVLFTSTHYLKMHPQQVAAFRAATLKGLNYALSRPQELVELILARYNSQNKSREHLLFEAKKIQELTRPDIVEPGYMSPGRWQHVADVYSSLDKLPADLSLKPFIYDLHPEKDLRWLYLALAISLLVLAIVSIALWHNRRLNQRLLDEISAREQAQANFQASESRFKDLFDKNPDPCWLSAGDTLIECNKAAVQQLRYQQKQQLLAKQLSSIAIANYGNPPTPLSAMLAQTAEVGSGRFEWQFKTANNETIPVEVTLAHYQMQNQSIIYCVWRDISERKRIEQIKNEFVSTVSHELRTPLTSVIGALGLVNGGALGSIPEKMKPLTDIALNNANRLLLLINDILDLSKIEAGQMTYEQQPVEINQLVEQAVRANEHYGKQFGTRFVIHADAQALWVLGDENRLLQVLNNLLSNAAKFSPTDAEVIITTHGENEQASIQVKDVGSGIPYAFQPRLFEKFTQADSSDTRRIGGTGLGLNISKAIVTAHQGDIGFKSAPGEGSTFIVTLPRLQR